MSSLLFFSQSHISPYLYEHWYLSIQSRALLCEFLELSPCISLLPVTLHCKLQLLHSSQTGFYLLRSGDHRALLDPSRSPRIPIVLRSASSPRRCFHADNQLPLLFLSSHGSQFCILFVIPENYYNFCSVF